MYTVDRFDSDGWFSCDQVIFSNVFRVFRATVSILSDRCLSVCPSVLSCLFRWCIVAKRFDGSR